MQAGGRGLGVHLGDRTLTSTVSDPVAPPATATVPAPRLSALLARVGDPVPVWTPAGPRAAADLVAAHLQEAVGAAGGRGGPLVLAVPDHWRGHRRSALARAAAAAGLGPVASVGSAVAVALGTAFETPLPDPALLAVVEVGEEAVSAVVVRVGGRAVGEVAPPAPPSCWPAEDDPAATVPGQLRRALELAGVPGGDLAGVVLAGSGARLPSVVAAVTAEVGRAPIVPADPESAAARGAALAARAAAELAPVPHPVPAATVEPVGPVEPAGPAGPRVGAVVQRPAERPGRHRRSTGQAVAPRRLAVLGALALSLLLGGSVALAASSTDSVGQPGGPGSRPSDAAQVHR